jgi:hypothetical protein
MHRYSFKLSPLLAIWVLPIICVSVQVRAILAKEGLRGLYAGYGAFLLRDLPFDAIEFVAYEQLRKAAATFLKRDPNAGEVALVGAAAGGITGAVPLVGCLLH